VFRDIESADEHWVATRESSLHDVALLLAELDGECAQLMSALIDYLATQNALDKAHALKCPAFEKALGNLTDEVLSAYDEMDQVRANGGRIIRLRQSVKAVSTISPADSAFPDMPKVAWIRIVTGAAGAQFSAGDEYGIEIDSNVDVPWWEAATRSALELIALSHDNEVLVRTFVSYIVPLKQREEVQNLSFSSRELPNVVFKNNEAAPFRFGETLVHEADHQFFYALEEYHTFWTADPQTQAAVHFSPWRDDSRPLDGILRGLSAFTRVSLYYEAVLRSGVDRFAGVVGPLLVQRIVECKDAAETLSQSAQLSPTGAAYVQELTDALREAEQSAIAHEDYPRWKSDALGILAAHRERWRLSRIDDPSKITRDYL